MRTKVAHEKNIIHVMPLGNGWAIKTANSEKFIVITSTKSEAVTAGKTMAKSSHCSLIIHGKDGRITERSNYAARAAYPHIRLAPSRAGEPQPRSYSKAKSKK